MISITIENMKNFMNEMLCGNLFDDYLFEEATVFALSNVTFDGHINREFLLSDQTYDYDFRPFSDIKPILFDLIKGKRAPLYFKFVLHLKPELSQKLLSDSNQDYGYVKSLMLCIKYDGGNATVTSGVSYNTFVLDKEADRIWDNYLSDYLS